MNDSLLYFLLYTVGCFVLGFAVGGMYEARISRKALDLMYEKYKESLKALGDAHEKHIAALSKHDNDGHNSSEHVPTYTA